MRGHVLESVLKMGMFGGQTTAEVRGEAWLQVSNTYDETRKQQTYKHNFEDN